jgi:hypothetical protein
MRPNPNDHVGAADIDAAVAMPMMHEAIVHLMRVAGIEAGGPAERFHLSGPSNPPIKWLLIEESGRRKMVKAWLASYELESLTAVYAEWCAKNGLPVASADELLAEIEAEPEERGINGHRKAWLRDFIRRWNAAADAENAR